MAAEHQRRRGTARVSLALLATMLASSVASAQVIDNYFSPSGAAVGGGPTDSSQGQALREFDTSGIHTGSFVIRPDLAESGGYNTNVEGFKNGRGSSFVNTVASVQASSDWSRNSAYVLGTVNDERYLDVPNQSFTNWTLATGGTVDVGNDRIGATYSHLNLTQTPGGIDAVSVAVPVSFRTDTLQLSYTATNFGRFSFIPTASVTKYDFSNYLSGGTLVDQTYRNRVILQGGLTTRYDLAGQRQLLFVVQGNHIDYLNTTAGVPKRDSNDITVLGGIDYPAPGANIRFRVLAGVQGRFYANKAYSELISPTVEASITWTPTRLTTVTLLARRDIEDAADESIAGYTYSTARLSVAHELRRNVLITGYVEAQLADYQASKLNILTPSLQEAGTTQTLYNAGASATWLLNRNVRAGVTYSISDRTGGVSTSDYISHIGMLTIGFRL